MILSRLRFLPLPKYASMLLFYSTIMLFVSLSDGIMSYVSPYFIESYVQNTFTMGLIIATSSVVGILCDALIPSFFRAKHFMFFLWNTVILAMLFPSIFLFFPHTVAVFILAMAVWGVYFELMVFAESYFIEAAIPAQHHALACGVLNSFKSLSFLLAPLFVPYLIDQGIQIPLYTAMVMLLFSLSAIFAFKIFSLIINNIIPKRPKK